MKTASLIDPSAGLSEEAVFHPRNGWTKKTIRRRMVVHSSKKSATPLQEAAVTQFQIPIPLPPLA